MVRNKALPEEKMRAVETGGCPHAAIREVTAKVARLSKELAINEPWQWSFILSQLYFYVKWMEVQCVTYLTDYLSHYASALCTD